MEEYTEKYIVVFAWRIYGDFFLFIETEGLNKEGNGNFFPWLSDLHVFVSLAHFISACSKNSFTFLRACNQGKKPFYFFNK